MLLGSRDDRVAFEENTRIINNNAEEILQKLANTHRGTILIKATVV